jgi:hypothetical protein
MSTLYPKYREEFINIARKMGEGYILAGKDQNHTVKLNVENGRIKEEYGIN